MLGQFLPSLGDSLGTFPMPGFLGMELHGVEVSRVGQFMSVFARLQP
jgi:hypothetical protein